MLWQINELNARGQVKESVLGNGIVNTNEYDSNGYLSNIKYDKANGQVNVLTLNTKFDFKTDNLENRTNTIFNNYKETFKYDEIDRLQEFTNKLGVQETQKYEPSGKIKENNLGVYNYSNDKPYQNISITLTPQAYDYYANREGNFKEGASATERKLDITYNAFKSPLEITETTIDKISFSYNDYNQRSTMYYGSMEDKMLRPYRKHYAADGTIEIKENIKTGATEFVTYIGGDVYTAPVVQKSDGINTPNYLYLHRDYQGSILAITDANANVVEKRLFDAWGAIIKVQDGAGNTLAGLTVLDRGYTGHEHLQSVGLINMNARLYDPMLRRFLQVDNYIQDVTNTQNYNQYGYVVNNPLKYTDPSGNAFGDGKDCVGCNNNNYPEYNPDKMVDNKLLADEISHWVGGWASARNIDEAGTAVGKAFRDAFNFIGRNISSLFGGGRRSGPPPNRSSYVSLNNTSLTGAYPGNNYSNTKYNITSDYSIYLRPVDFEKVTVKTNEVATSTAIITAGLEATGRAAPYMNGIGKYAGNISTVAQVVDHSYKFSKDEKNGGISGGRYSYRMTGTMASWGVGTAISSWGVGGSFAGPYGVLAGVLIGVGFQGIEYSYDIVAPQVQGSFNHFFNSFNRGNFVR